MADAVSAKYVKYRVKVTKILEDGTELEVISTEDYPAYVRMELRRLVARMGNSAGPVEVLPGQEPMFEAAA